MLGPRAPGRPGHLDWRGKTSFGLANAACGVVEAVQAWRSAASGAKPRRRANVHELEGHLRETYAAPTAPKPFVWAGENALLRLFGALDWLRCEELVALYGPDYPFARNPFALGLPVDARPPSPKAPPGGIVVTILLEEKVEEVSEHLLAQRLMEEAAITHYDAALNACPSWWPPRGDASHQDRVRACAKVLLDEERALRRVEDARRRKDGVGV